MRWISLVLLAALVVTPLAQITMRGVFNVPMSGAEELARYFLICLTFVAASYVTEQGGQIRMEEFQGLLPPKPRWYLQLAIELAGVAMFGVLFVAAVVTIGEQPAEPDRYAGDAVLAVHGSAGGRLAAARGRNARDVRSHLAATSA